MKLFKDRSFTLIELLIVITIIMLLAAFIIVSISNARESSRDGKRIADLSTIQLAMEMYKDSKGVYPNVWSVGGWSGVDYLTTTTPEFSKYLSPIPKDPTLGANGYKMIGDLAVPNAYWLMARFEDNSSVPNDSKFGTYCYQIWGGTATAKNTQSNGANCD